MIGWRLAVLEEVAKLDRAAVEPDEIKPGTSYVGLENIESGGSFTGVKTVEAGELASNKFAFTSQHLLFGKLRPYLAKIARPAFSGICSTDILPVLPGPDLDRDYLAHYLLSPAMVAQAASLAAGANLPRLSPSALLKFKVPLPPLSDQRRIAAILDKADELRAKRRAALAQLDTLTQSIFLDKFGDPMTNTGDWPTEPLGGLLESGPQNGLYRPASDYGSGTPIVRIDAFYDGVLGDTHNLKRVRISDSERKSYELRVGDILINRVNSREYLGKSALVPELVEPTVFESNMMRLGVDRQRLNPVFVIQFLQTKPARTHFQMCAKDAVNQSSINQQDVQALPVPLPPLPIQDDFASLVGVVGAHASRNLASAANGDRLFASLQHRAFTGEL